MSDYEVNLVNDSMQEFYVMFNGPEESELRLDQSPTVSYLTHTRQPLLRGEFGRFTLSSQTNIRIRALVSAL